MFDCMGQLDSSNFMMNCHTETGEVRIEYESSDGITYTRTDTTGNPVDLGTEIYYERAEYWNDVIGKFIQVGGNVFEGLYEYMTKTDTNKSAWVTNIRVVDENIVYDVDKINGLNVSEMSDMCNEILNHFDLDTTRKHYVSFVQSGDTLCAYVGITVVSGIKYADNLSLVQDTANNWGIGTYSSELTDGMYKITLGDTLTYTKLPAGTKIPVGSYTWGHWKYGSFATSDKYTILEIYNTAVKPASEIAIYGYNVTDTNSRDNYGETTKFYHALTQLSAISDYVYEKEFYGKNGAEIGTLTKDISNSFADTNAEIYSKIKNYYDSLEPRVLTDDDKTIDKNIYFIHAKKNGTPLLDTSSVTDMDYMFSNCTNLTEIPLLDTSSATTMQYMFRNCTNLTEIPLLDTSNVIDIRAMFSGCKNLTTIPLLDTSRATNMYQMFYGCTNLIEIPLLDTSRVTTMLQMFQNCTNLTTVPELNTSSVISMIGMFSNCTNLITIPRLNTSNVTYIQNMFYNCTNLTDESLNTILAMCTNATAYITQGTNMTLKYIGLTSEQATKCQSLSNYSAFTSAGWTTGY